jgi:hypothetical protein
VRLTYAEGFGTRQVPVAERMVSRLSPSMPPGYHENAVLEEGVGGPARPDAVVTVAERVEAVDLGAQPPQDVRPFHPVHSSRIPPKAKGRWGFMRRLMSSTESTV